MKELSLKNQLIQDIRVLNPELLAQVYHYFELLKSASTKKVKSWKSYIGCVSDREAIEQKKLIEKEFGNIEGEW